MSEHSEEAAQIVTELEEAATNTGLTTAFAINQTETGTTYKVTLGVGGRDITSFFGSFSEVLIYCQNLNADKETQTAYAKAQHASHLTDQRDALNARIAALLP